MKPRTLVVFIFLMLALWLPALADELVLPDDLKDIEAMAFFGDTSLDAVVLPDGLETIGSQAFAQSSITSINLPATLTTIADNAFDEVTDLHLTAVENTFAYDWAVEQGYIVPSNESPVEDFTFQVLTDTTCAVASYTGSDTTIVIPSHDSEGRTVVRIKAYAFQKNKTLKDVTLPDTILSIGDNAFRDCSNIVKLTLSKNLTSIESYAFMWCDGITEIYIPASVISVGSSIFNECESTLSAIYCVKDGAVWQHFTDYDTTFANKLVAWDGVSWPE